ncbi:TetR/AcrR family transcriptional regulator [Pseudonocardia sp. GCM10023141]|uniref:TetR/AcrR family transcriptional regulator n=1 Tax=Pseudonocardia sp. GCM10023141 TaxID=3252653 RepID=UPI0036170821
MPPVNEERRALLADAALTVIARLGPPGLSHRAVDEEAAVPKGTTSNYFRTRQALLVAALTRVAGLHLGWIAEERAKFDGPLDRDGVAEVMSAVVEQAITTHRAQYIALFELALESTRRPELLEIMPEVFGSAVGVLQEAHRSTEPNALELRMVAMFYNGAVFTSLVVPNLLGGLAPRDITRAMLRLVLTGRGD